MLATSTIGNTLNRREIVAGAGVLLAHGVFGPGQATAATGGDVLQAQSPLGDIVIGNADAPLTLVEYASASCAYSAKFQREVLPDIKGQYIATGKLKLVWRELPQNDRVIAVTLLARCLPRERYFDAYDALFENQDTWVNSESPGPSITRIVTSFGMTKQVFEQCLADVQEATQLKAFTRRTVQEFGIVATPTFFLDGQKIFGRVDMANLRFKLFGLIDDALKGQSLQE